MDNFSICTSFNTIIIAKNVLQLIQNHLQLTEYSSESGGVLAGKILNNNNWEINYASYPQKNDLSSRNRYHRSSDHQAILVKLWQESGETITLLGTWHTHPEARPQPSYVDLKDWRRILKKSIYHGDYLLFIIAGTEVLNFWLGEKLGEINFLRKIYVTDI